MNSHKLILSVLLALAIFSVQKVCADQQDLKTLVWKDCDKALILVQNLPAENRQSAVDLLFEIVRLKLTAIEPKFSFQPELIKAPIGVMEHVNLAQSISSEDQIRAKQCALSLLPLMPLRSQFILPELIKLSQDQTEDFVIRLRIKQSILEIAKSFGNCREATNCISKELLKEIKDQHLLSKSDISEQLLVLFSEQTSDILFDNLLSLECLNPECSEVKNNLELLSKLDFRNWNLSSNNLYKRLTDILESSLTDSEAQSSLSNSSLQSETLPATPQPSTENDMQTVAQFNFSSIKLTFLLEAFASIPQFYEQLLTFMLSKLTDSQQLLIKKGVKQETIYKIIAQIFNYEAVNRSLVIDPELRLKMFDLLPSVSEQQRDVLQQGLLNLSAYGRDFDQKVEKIALSKDADLRRRSAIFAAKIDQKSKQIENILLKLVKDSVLEVQIQALKSISSNKALSDKKLIENIIKKLSALYKDRNQNIQTTATLTSDFLASLNKQVYSTQLSELIWTTLMLTYRCQDCQQYLPQFKQYLFDQRNFLRSKFKQGNKNQDKDYKLLKLYLSAELINSALQDEVISDLLSLLGDSDTDISIAAELLILNQNQIPGALKHSAKITNNIAYEFNLVDQLKLDISILSCDKYDLYIQKCRNKSIAGPFCKKIFSGLGRCIGQIDLSSWRASDFSTLFQSDPESLRQLIESADNNSYRCELIKAGIDRKFLKATEYPFVCSSLASINCKELLPQILIEKDISSACFATIKQVFESSQSANSAELFRMLVLLDPTGINISTIYSDALERKDFSLLMVLRDTVLVDELVNHTRQLLMADTLSTPEIILILNLIEKLGSRAEMLVPDLIRLSERTEYFYESSRAIISVASNNINLRMEVLKKLIGSIGFPRLIKELDLNNLAATAAALMEAEAISLTYLEKRDLNALLGYLSGQQAVHQELY